MDVKIKYLTSSGAFTLPEVLIAATLGVLTVTASIYGYVQSAKRAEWSGYNLAAHSLAVQRMEQARACRWDPLSYSTNNDDLISANFPVVSTNVLDIPISGTNVVYATNFTTISVLSTNPPLKMIRVDCVWKFQGKGPFTNTVVTYRAPDQ